MIFCFRLKLQHFPQTVYRLEKFWSEFFLSRGGVPRDGIDPTNPTNPNQPNQPNQLNQPNQQKPTQPIQQQPVKQ